MTSPAPTAPSPLLGVARGAAGLGLLGLAVITLASPGATRMYAWPWSLAYAGALLGPALALIFRALDPRAPLILPSRAWQVAAGGFAAVVVLSALLSPYRAMSLLWSAPLLSAVAFFFLAFDALRGTDGGRARWPAVVGGALVAITGVSLALWLPTTAGRGLDAIALARNAFPLGHSNYTGGLAVLALPVFVGLAFQGKGTTRAAWAASAGLALVMLLTSGSRSALTGAGAAGLAGLWLSPLGARKKLLATGALILTGLVLVVAHPRFRTLLARTDPAAEPNLSTVQRSAMLTAAVRMGQDRPLLGWGPGTTPLAYPRYRAGLDGGAENVLQLHSTPAQLWAELGAAGLACGLAFLALAWGGARRQPVAFVAVLGYAVCAMGDWQLDVPVFGFSLALGAALLAPAAEMATPSARGRGFGLGGATLVALGLVMVAGERDPAPKLNTTALRLARDPAKAPEAIALLRQSLALNPDQEIAHFNLGWLLVVRDPAAAERHFGEAARLVPDKGGVYFGLGLARLNQNRRTEAARAWALEALNDPLFLSSPWWGEPTLASLREATMAEFTSLVAQAQSKLPAESWAAQQLRRVASLTIAAAPGSGRAYRRERTAYPVLMRNLDLAPPTDLYDVREPVPPPTGLPAKGWLPSPLLLELLDAPPRKP